MSFPENKKIVEEYNQNTVGYRVAGDTLPKMQQPCYKWLLRDVRLTPFGASRRNSFEVMEVTGTY
jgi:hypothetical protein